MTTVLNPNLHNYISSATEIDPNFLNAFGYAREGFQVPVDVTQFDRQRVFIPSVCKDWNQSDSLVKTLKENTNIEYSEKEFPSPLFRWGVGSKNSELQLQEFDTFTKLHLVQKTALSASHYGATFLKDPDQAVILEQSHYLTESAVIMYLQKLSKDFINALNAFFDSMDDTSTDTKTLKALLLALIFAHKTISDTQKDSTEFTLNKSLHLPNPNSSLLKFVIDPSGVIKIFSTIDEMTELGQINLNDMQNCFAELKRILKSQPDANHPTYFKLIQTEDKTTFRFVSFNKEYKVFFSKDDFSDSSEQIISLHFTAKGKTSDLGDFFAKNQQSLYEETLQT